VIHTPLPSLVHGDDPGRDVDDFCRLLASGKHVITTVGYMYPVAHGQELVDRLTAACRQGDSSFHGTGANPGWFGDVLPLVMSGLSLRIDRVSVQEISSFQYYPSPEIMFEMMGFGRTPDDFQRRGDRHRSWLDGLFTEAVQMVAHGLGVEVDEVTSTMPKHYHILQRRQRRRPRPRALVAARRGDRTLGAPRREGLVRERVHCHFVESVTSIGRNG
jgi:hypothetical protein